MNHTLARLIALGERETALESEIAGLTAELADVKMEIAKLEAAEEDGEGYYEDRLTDVEADADTLRSAGMGTDEDYGCFYVDEGY